MEKYFDLLMENPLFAGIGREELASMLGCLNARATQVKKGDPVFLEGDPAGFIGIVLSGAVRIVRDDYYGQRSFLTQAEPGDRLKFLLHALLAEAGAGRRALTSLELGIALADHVERTLALHDLAVSMTALHGCE